MKFILGRKIGMSQIFDQEKVVPVTAIEAGPCFVLQVKEVNKDGYQAVQVGFEELPKRKVSKSKKNKGYQNIKEFCSRKSQKEIDKTELKVGDQIKVDIFEIGEEVKVAGVSKGKGFQGGVKRHGFSGGPASHGHRHVLRTIGSVGSAFPQRVIKGRKMPGHAGAQRVTVSGLKIVKTDIDNNLLLLQGAVPGPNGGLLEISQ